MNPPGSLVGVTQLGKTFQTQTKSYSAVSAPNGGGSYAGPQVKTEGNSEAVGTSKSILYPRAVKKNQCRTAEQITFQEINVKEQYLALELIDQVADEIRKRSQVAPRIGMILGSGLGPLAEEVEEPDYISYEDLPGWPVSTLAGHTGRLVLGELEGQPVVIMQGRTHYYEG